MIRITMPIKAVQVSHACCLGHLSHTMKFFRWVLRRFQGSEPIVKQKWAKKLPVKHHLNLRKQDQNQNCLLVIRSKTTSKVSEFTTPPLGGGDGGWGLHFALLHFSRSNTKIKTRFLLEIQNHPTHTMHDVPWKAENKVPPDKVHTLYISK